MKGHLLRCRFGLASSRTNQYAPVRDLGPPLHLTPS
jgi:hypothetical protein